MADHRVRHARLVLIAFAIVTLFGLSPRPQREKLPAIQRARK